MNASDTERRGFLVRGRVQGVGFRWWTQRTGTALGLTGHVRNLPSGDVEVHAAGSGDQLDAFARVLHAGPPMSKVTSVVALSPDPRTPTDGFHMELW